MVRSFAPLDRVNHTDSRCCVSGSVLLMCPAAEDTVLFVIHFFLIGVKSASFAYASLEDILLEERWEWKWVEKHPKREEESVL